MNPELVRLLGKEEKVKVPLTKAVGIDLGTTYSCVAAMINGKVEVIANDGGERTTASVVAFIDEEDKEVVGGAALDQAPRNPTNTVYDAKRLIGRSWNEQCVLDDIPTWPFDVFKNEKEKVKVMVEHRGERKEFFPQEISAMVLSKMKSVAEKYIGKPVSHAVITVPAYFNTKQRKATREAARLAGLEVIRLFPEPSAAALTYSMQRVDLGEQRRRTVLIYDLGGGTFDVTVASVIGSRVDVCGIGGDSHLGGQDFNQRLLQHVAQEIRVRTGRDVLSDKKKRRRLLHMCENAKRELTVLTRTDIDVLPVIGDVLIITVFRAKFENLCQDLLNKTVDTVKRVLDDVEVAAAQVDEVVLVGGSTRMPCVPRLLQSVFPGKTITRTVNPDEAVAHGAALLAASYSKELKTSLLDGVLVSDVTPLSFGVAEEDGAYEIIIPRNTVIPVRKTKTFATVYKNQEHYALSVYQGERRVASRNHFIGEYSVENLPPCDLKGGIGHYIKVALVIDEDGVLSVSAKHPATGQWEGCTLEKVQKAEQGTVATVDDCFRGDDLKEMARLRARFNLLKLINNSGMSGTDFDALVRDMRTWLDTYGEVATEADFSNKSKEMRTRKGKIAYGSRKRSKRIEEKNEASVAKDWQLILSQIGKSTDVVQIKEEPADIFTPIVQIKEESSDASVPTDQSAMEPSEILIPSVRIKEEPSENLYPMVVVKEEPSNDS